jgi:hypothetical protein
MASLFLQNYVLEQRWNFTLKPTYSRTLARPAGRAACPYRQIPSGCTAPSARFQTVFGNRPSQNIPAMANQMKTFAGTDS